MLGDVCVCLVYVQRKDRLPFLALPIQVKSQTISDDLEFLYGRCKAFVGFVPELTILL